ncbi:hypothetical protein PHLGIDRAFT_18157 [Phlebiopsis gigantea 11061_1 CR5-6]|uniref:Uncharacterized protein n=1 Tax=Phlebiopsis gigantea (strain 11061_1 CR5-6) TaxID=745531 RepID=A0A0C3S4U1_PHLG1|nr:hypothetical protein PHLGIDRAFT_18157 [Phlebiopsis gigantea 11061_1 CR5-6]
MFSKACAAQKRVRHPKEGTCGPHRADPRFPPSAPEGRPTPQHAFWVQHMRGECRRSALEECSR